MIESLHSPHVARVKALIGSKGASERRSSGLFVAEGIQAAREALEHRESGIEIETLYYTAEGSSRISELDLRDINAIEVSDAVMKAMSDTVTPQGVVAICNIPTRTLSEFASHNTVTRAIYLHEIQDPGNAGTILRSADACGFDVVITSPQSVDFFSPKVVRSTAGSLWNIPLFQGVTLTEVMDVLPSLSPMILSSHASTSILEIDASAPILAIFGNEARGVVVADLDYSGEVAEVTIPMAGNAESLNLSAAASIVMFQLSSKTPR